MDLAAYLSEGKDPTHASGMNPAFQAALLNMFASAPPEIQQGFRIFSGYRSPERQAQLFNAAVKRYGSVSAARKWVAPPGRSQHNNGMAADLRFASDAAKAWAHQNAAKYGLRFPMGHEPWHIELSSARGGSAGRYGGGATEGDTANVPSQAMSAMGAPPPAAAGRTIEPPAPAFVPPATETALGNIVAGLGSAIGGAAGGAGAGFEQTAAPMRESGPLAGSQMANQGVMDSRALQDSLMPVPEEVATGVEPMKLAQMFPQGPASPGPFSTFQPMRSRPRPAPLMGGGISLRA
jgi:hypothetical protein